MNSQCFCRIKAFFEKNEYFAAALFFGFLLLILFYNVVFLNATLLTSALTSGTMPNGPYGYTGPRVPFTVIDPGAPAWQYEPSFALASNIYKSGGIPLWNPYIAIGIPFAADMLSALFFPLNFLVYFAPKHYFWSMLDFILLFRLFIAGFFTYCFMREIKVNKYGSFTSAIAFMFSGYFIFYINMTHLNVEILIPVLLFAFEKLIKMQNIKYCFFSAIVIAIAVFGGMPESTLFAFFLVSLYYFYRVFYESKKERNLAKVKEHTFWFLSAFVLGILLSAALTLPFIEYLGQSCHVHPQSTGLRSCTFSFDTISILVPYFFGWIHNTWSGLSQHAILPGIGILTFFFALCAFSKKNKKNQISLFFAGFAIFYLLKTYGIPVINWIGYLPLFNVSIFPKYCFPEFAFCMAVLAGIGIANISKLSFKRLLSQSLLIILIIVIFLIGNVDKILHNTWNFLDFGVELWILMNVGFALLILSVLISVLYIASKGIVNQRRMTYILILLLIVELFVFIPHFRPQRCDPFEPAPYIQFLKNDSEVFRVVGMNSLLYPNTAGAHEIFDIRQLMPMAVDRYSTFFRRTIDSTVTNRFTGKNLDIDNKTVRFLNLLNVRYILTTSRLDCPLLAEYSLIDDILDKGEIISVKKNFVSKTQFDGKTVLFEHPPSRVNYQLIVPNGSVFLNFSIGLHSATWSPDKGDGVLFEIFIVEPKNEQKLFSKYIDPKNKPQDRKWHNVEIDLSNYTGERINLSLVTLPGPKNSTAYDWAGWGELYLKTPESEKRLKEFNKKFELVYDEEIKIYKNNHAFPRSFIVHQVVVLKSKDDIFDKLKNEQFDLRNNIIIEKEPPEMGNLNRYAHRSPFVDNSSSEIKEYQYNKVMIDVNMENPGFLVLTDTYYPGWKVYVDGEEKKILVADYLFRAVFLEEGLHSVEFIYDPFSFKIGFWISCFALFSILIICLIKLKALFRLREFKPEK